MSKHNDELDTFAYAITAMAAAGYSTTEKTNDPVDEQEIILAAEDAAKEAAAVRAATEQAREFRDRLEAVGISYTELLGLMNRQLKLDHIAHNILVGWETGRTYPWEKKTTPP